MLYLLLGYSIVGLSILASLPFDDTFNANQIMMLIGIAFVFDLITVVPYLVGRFFSKTESLHWSTLVFIGLVMGLLWDLLIPTLNVLPSDSDISYAGPMFLFMVLAFASPKIEFWRRATPKDNAE
ncbi:hypothetical protein [Alteromonas facilis]|uniref:hypothetical protein n=1 Tax=Alteromonas facilis TaxID=2048004 RepID=UPI000C285113|nr:hypothetical protein [Alteromonas facilis]